MSALAAEGGTHAGDPGRARDQALLGVVTLEILGLVLHPFKRTLELMRMILG